MDRLLVDWPVAGAVLDRVAALLPTAEAGDLCRKRGLAAYAAALEDEDRFRLLAFVDAVLDSAANQLEPARKDARADDLAGRVLPIRVRAMLDETRARKLSLAAAN